MEYIRANLDILPTRRQANCPITPDITVAACLDTAGMSQYSCLHMYDDHVISANCRPLIGLDADLSCYIKCGDDILKCVSNTSL